MRSCLRRSGFSLPLTNPIVARVGNARRRFGGSGLTRPACCPGRTRRPRSTHRARPPGPATRRSPGQHGRRVRGWGTSGWDSHRVAPVTGCTKAQGQPRICWPVGLALTTHHTFPKRAHPEEAKQVVPQSSGQQSPQPSTSDFGANEWLVEEMRERYKADPSSVDATWADYFSNGSAAAPAPRRPATARVTTEPKQAAPAAKTEQKAAPKAEPKQRAAAGEGRGEGAAEGRVRGQARAEGRAPPAEQGRRARQGHHQPDAQGVAPGRAGRGQRRADLHRAARRPGPHRAATWTPR